MKETSHGTGQIRLLHHTSTIGTAEMVIAVQYQINRLI
jgi:hypothetical protein